jgi:hypothetical protein
MATKDPRIDTYIAKAAPFAKPILTYLRQAVHAGCPNVEETMKWSFPHFDYKGVMCGMAAFTGHCTFGFWKGALLTGHGLTPADENAMGQFGRIGSLEDLPRQTALVALVKAAAKLNDDGVRLVRTATKKPPLRTPGDLMTAIRRNQKALATFNGFSPSHKREYVEWVTEAKTDQTRTRRIQAAVVLMTEGKARHWKYVR